MHIRVNDTVEVLTGDDRGVRGKVLSVDRAAGKLIVEGVNRVFKHVRRSQRNPQGGRLSKEMPVQISNVLLVCSACNAPTRTGARYRADGSKERFCKKCGKSLGQIAPARTAYAQKR
jgi:large subunit ribosomal protein L24